MIKNKLEENLSLVIVFVLVSVVIISVVVSVSTGTNCGYHYVDMHGNEGTAYFCEQSVSGLTCGIGTNIIQVSSFEWTCEK